MNLNNVFDTLVYGKGTVTRGDYSMYASVLTDGKSNDIGSRLKEGKTTSFYVMYRGTTMLVLQRIETGRGYESTVVYEGLDRHTFHKNINRTIKRIISYETEPYSKYKEKYLN